MSQQHTSRPELVTPEHLTYLDELRASGIVNMFGAVPFLKNRFPDLDTTEATAVLVHWMHTFSERHPDAEQS